MPLINVYPGMYYAGAGTPIVIDYLPPKLTFLAGLTWTSIPTIPASATNASYEIEAISIDQIVGRLCTDVTPDPNPNLEWMLVNWQTGTISTREEIENFKVLRSSNTTSLIVRMAFYGT